MFSDGYESYCSELIDNATGHEGSTHKDLCACDKFELSSNSDNLTS